MSVGLSATNKKNSTTLAQHWFKVQTHDLKKQEPSPTTSPLPTTFRIGILYRIYLNFCKTLGKPYENHVQCCIDNP
jgi:hypothetical protein